MSDRFPLNVLLFCAGEYLASFFLDPYSRPSEKRGGAWMESALGKIRLAYFDN